LVAAVAQHVALHAQDAGLADARLAQQNQGAVVAVDFVHLVDLVKNFVCSHELLGCHDFVERRLDVMHARVRDCFALEHVLEDVFEAGIVDAT